MLYIYFLLIALCLGAIWITVGRSYFNRNVKHSREDVTYKMFSKALLKELDKYLVGKHNVLLREAVEKHSSEIVLRIDEYALRRKLPEFDIDYIVSNGLHLGIFSSVTDIIKDNYLGMVSGVDFKIDYGSQRTDGYIIVTILINWRG